MTDTKEHPIREARRLVTLALTLVILGALCFGGGFLVRGLQADPPPELSAIVVQNELRQVSQLATARYGYTNMGQFEQTNDFYGITLPFTTKRFIVAYEGEILAGVDLEKAKVDLTGQQLTVSLPKAEILSHEIDENSLEIFDESRNIFNPITISDYNGFHLDQKGKMEEKAIGNGLLTLAEDQARRVAEQILRPLAEQSELELIIQST
ncbi:MAG: DUF4230 domain-containing protein [Oscillospiraceae bacterium]|nr:DUF4230 domain-containing protein [Oscillospiraceae bacterium]